MLGDYCDYDEFTHGQRREGLFSAVSGWIMKAGSSLAFGISVFCWLGRILAKTLVEVSPKALS